MEGPDPTWLSLLPALVTIFLAFATRQVLVALFAGILAGSAVLLLQAGSVAQVHRATLPGGDEVAVKVRRPGLDELVRFDFAVSGLVARVIAGVA